MDLQDRIIYFIENSNESLKEMSKKLKIPYTTLMQYKSNKRGIPSSFIEKLVSAYPELSINWMLKGEGEMFSNTPPQINQWENDLIQSIKNDPQLELILQELKQDKLTKGILYSLLSAKSGDKTISEKDFDRFFRVLRTAFESK